MISNDKNLPVDDEMTNKNDQAEETTEPVRENEAEETVDEAAEPISEEADIDKNESEESAEKSIESEESAEGEEEIEDDPYEGGKYSTDPDDIAYVAERITGARHSVSATAAPIRIREKGEEHSEEHKNIIRGVIEGNKTSDEETDGTVPAAVPADVADAAEKTEENSGAGTFAHGKLFRTVVASAAALIVILTALIVSVNVVLGKEQPVDYDMSDIRDELPEVIEPENDPVLNETAGTEAETDTSADTETETSDTKESETEAETEPPRQLYTVKLDFYSRQDIDVSTEQITFGELLDKVGCKLAEGEVPSVSLDHMIAADCVITIDKITYGSETVTETIAYESEVINVDTIPRGTTNYIRYGESGTKEKVYTIEYKNGVEQSRSLASENITKWPVNEKYEIGVGGSFVGSDGVTYTYSHRRVVPATYYNLEGLTYLGTMADESVIAVDKNYIPLGTRLYVKNDKYDFGVRIASDVGSMIKEWEVDIWIDDSNPQLESFASTGYHYDMEIYYID